MPTAKLYIPEQEHFALLFFVLFIILTFLIAELPATVSLMCCFSPSVSLFMFKPTLLRPISILVLDGNYFASHFKKGTFLFISAVALFIKATTVVFSFPRSFIAIAHTCTNAAFDKECCLLLTSFQCEVQNFYS